MTNSIKSIFNTRLAVIMIAIAMVFSVANPTYAKQKITKENKTFYVKSSSADVRSGYSTKHKVVKTFKKNTKLSSYEKTTASGTVWYHIKWTENKKSKYGWISSTNVTTKAPVTTTVKKENKTLYVSVTKANVRSGASAKNKLVTTFKKNTKLSSYETKNIGKETWYHIKWTENKKSKTGWVQSTTVTTKAPAPAIKKDSKTFYVSTSSAKVYSSYSTKSKVVKTFSKNTKLSSYEKTTVSGKVWYHIKYTESKKTKTGWVQSSNLSTRPVDGWVAPVLKSGYSSDKNKAYKIFENELGFTDGWYYGVKGQSRTITVNYNISHPIEVIISFSMWENESLSESYRIPIVAKQLFKFYFGEKDATKLVGYFNKDDIPEKFTMNNRTIKAMFVEKSGTLMLKVGKPGVKW